MRIVAPSCRLAVVAGVVSAPLFAQSTQYIAPGTLGEPPEARRERIERAVEEARWRWGALRVEPWLALREVAWVEQQDPEQGTVGDLTATAGAGLHLFLPVGGRTTLAAQVMPEYVWWRERTEDRRLAGRYGAGVFSYGNRLSLELFAKSTDESTYATPELDQRIDAEERRVEGHLAVPFGHAFAVFARGAASRSEFDGGASGPDFSALDREEQWGVAGVRWKPSATFTLGVGAGRTAADFETAGATRDNDGSSLYGEIDWRRPKLELLLEAFRVELEPASGSSFAPVEETLGRAQARWDPRTSLGLALYGLRSFQYSIEVDTTHFVDERWGGEVTLRPGSRSSLRVFAETGELQYPEVAGTPERRDDVASWGAGFEWRLHRSLTLSLGGRWTTIENGLLGTEREITELEGGLTFAAGGAEVF